METEQKPDYIKKRYHTLWHWIRGKKKALKNSLI